jgi:predicted dehydrogenase
VDLSYRGTSALREMRRLAPEIGRVYAADLVFHNAYGPSEAWARDRAASGGGCLIDLGIHLVDALLWVLASPPIEAVHGARWSRGVRLGPDDDVNEDHAVATITLGDGATARVACSWWLPAGQPAEIAVDLWGTDGALRLRNVGGSFYDFALARCRGASPEVIVSPPDDWGGRQLLAWVERLSLGASYDPSVEDQLRVAEILDAAAR